VNRIWVGFCLLGIVAFSISAYVAMATPPLHGPDEAAHAAYAMSLMDGDLPTIDTPMIHDPERYPQLAATLDGRIEDRRDAWTDDHLDVWTANHPPLYYAISVPLVAVADWWDRPGAALLGMRLLNALGIALSVVLVGLIARELVPRRPAVALLATALATGCGTALTLGGYIFNDGPGDAASSLTLLAGVWLLTRGPSRGRIVLATLAGTAAVGFRAPGLFAVAVCAAAAFCAVLLLPDSPVRRWLRATGAAAIVGGVPALAFGWFYVRNLRLYGDLGATAALLEKFDRRPRARSLLEVTLEPSSYTSQFRGLFFRVPSRVSPQELVPAPTVLLVLALLGLAVTALVAIRTRPRWPVPLRLAACWVMLVAHAALIEYSIWSFFVEGGNRHVRYAFPILPFLLTLVAVGLLGLIAWIPRRSAARLELIGTAVLGLFLLVGAFALQVQSVSRLDLSRGPFLSGHTVGVAGYGTALAVGIAAAVAFLVWLVWQIPGRAVDERDQQEHPEPAPALAAP
jgi:dolichyl-phosphate-mannose-protein mannosyltransferase